MFLIPTEDEDLYVFFGGGLAPGNICLNGSEKPSQERIGDGCGDPEHLGTRQKSNTLEESYSA